MGNSLSLLGCSLPLLGGIVPVGCDGLPTLKMAAYSRFAVMHRVFIQIQKSYFRFVRKADVRRPEMSRKVAVENAKIALRRS